MLIAEVLVLAHGVAAIDTIFGIVAVIWEVVAADASEATAAETIALPKP